MSDLPLPPEPPEQPPGWGGPPQPGWGGGPPPPPPPPPPPGAWREAGLRPVGEFLAGTFGLIGRTALPLLPLLIAVAVPVVVAFLAADAALGVTDWVDELVERANDLQPGDELDIPELDASTPTIVTWVVVLVVVNLAASVLVSIAGIVTLRAVQVGRTPSTGEILTDAARAFTPLLGLGLTVLGGAVGVMAVVAVLALLVPALGVLVLLTLVPLGAWLAIRLSLALPIAAIEHRAASALRRSWQLTRGHFWGALGRLLLYGLILGIAFQVVGLPLQFLTFLGSAALAVGTVLSFLVNLASTAVSQAGPLILYEDLTRDEEIAG